MPTAAFDSWSKKHPSVGLLLVDVGAAAAAAIFGLVGGYPASAVVLASAGGFGMGLVVSIPFFVQNSRRKRSNQAGSQQALKNPPWWISWILGYFVIIPLLLLFTDPVLAIGVAVAWTIVAPTYMRRAMQKEADPEKAARDEAREARRRQRDRL